MLYGTTILWAAFIFREKFHFKKPKEEKEQKRRRKRRK